MAFLTRHTIAVTIGLGLVLSAGCNSKSPTGRYTVSGTVTFQGKPLDQGTIEFAPEGGGAASGTVITGGAYTVPERQGLRPGSYQVRIYSSDAAATGPASEFPGQATQVAKERIPIQYNSKSTLTAKVQEGGSNQFNFDIP
jgi:hypothetical protein